MKHTKMRLRSDLRLPNQTDSSDRRFAARKRMERGGENSKSKGGRGRSLHPEKNSAPTFLWEALNSANSKEISHG